MSNDPALTSPPDTTGRPLPPLRWWMPLLVVGVGLLVWSRAVGGELVYDDLLLVERNPGIRSFSNFREVFGSGYWDFLGPHEAQRIGYYRPLTRIALMVGWQLGDGAPRAFHALSLVAHLLASLGVLLVARRLLRASVPALFAALVFCVHPLQVESVAWISAINDPMYGLFALLAVHAHLRWRDRGSRGVALLAPLYLALALLSKEHGLVTPILLLVVDIARAGPLGTRWRPFFRAYVPLLVVGVAYYLWRVQVFGDGGAGFDRTTTDFKILAGRQISLRAEMLGGWLGLLVWPGHLSLFRPVRPDLPEGDLTLHVAIIAILLALAFGTWHAWRGERRLLAALLLVPAALSPEMVRLESLGQFPLSDRFAYIAVAGFALWLAGWATRRLPRAVAIGTLCIAAAGLSARAFTQIGVWRDEETLFRKQVELEPRSVYARWGLGRVLLERFRASGSTDTALLQETLRTFESAQDLLVESQQPPTDVFATNEDFLQTHLGVAWSLVYSSAIDGFEDYSTSLTLFEMAAERLPYDDRAWVGIGLCQHKSGDLVAAESAYKEALKRNPASAETHRNYGLLLVDMGDLRRARFQFEQSIAERGENATDLVEIARCWHDDGWPDAAETAALRARELEPRAIEPLLVLATVEMTRRSPADALRRLDEALALDGRSGAAWLMRGKVLLTLDETADAIVALRNACEHSPANFEANYNLGLLLLQSGAQAAAVPHLDRAYRNAGGDRVPVMTLRESLGALLAGDAARLLTLSRVDSDRGDVEGAWRFAELAREADPSNPQVAIQRSVLLRALGRPEEALADLERAAQEHPESFDAALELGLLYRQMDRLWEALRELSRALELLPETAPPQLKRPIEQAIEELRGILGD